MGDSTTPDKGRTQFRRHQRPDRFTRVDNDLLRNPGAHGLRWADIGLLVYLLSKPDDWTVRVTDLVKQAGDGEHAVRSIFDRLEKAGFMRTEALRDESGRIVQWVREYADYPHWKQPDGGFPDVADPDVENHPLLSTEGVASTEVHQHAPPAPSPTDESFAEFWSLYPARDGRKLGKGKCQDRWRKLTPDDHEAAVAGAREYARERGGPGQVSPRDPERWLRDRDWTDFQPKGTTPPECSNDHAGRRDAALRAAAYHLNGLLLDGFIEAKDDETRALVAAGQGPYVPRQHYPDKAERDRIREAFVEEEGKLPSEFFASSGVGQ